MLDSQKVVEFVQTAAAVVKKAGSEVDRARGERAALAKQAAAVKTQAGKTADVLVAAGLYKSAQREAVVTALCNPQKALSYIAKLASQQVERSPEAIGRPDAARTKSASAQPGVVEEVEKASDRAWREGLARIPTI